MEKKKCGAWPWFQGSGAQNPTLDTKTKEILSTDMQLLSYNTFENDLFLDTDLLTDQQTNLDTGHTYPDHKIAYIKKSVKKILLDIFFIFSF